MSKNRIDEKFAALRKEGKKALMPFLTAGDPDLGTTARLILEFDKRGADLIELGVPFSDPIADGPVIQASYTRALEKDLHVRDILKMVSELRSQTDIPILTMISYSLVYKYGIEKYIKDAVASGVDGAIIPDLPVDEAGTVMKTADASSFNIVFLAAPTTTDERRKEIVADSHGFIYYISVTGITGERDKLPDDIADNLKLLKSMTDKPICIGFGVSTPNQAEKLSKIADGVIVGSAIVRLIAEHANDPADKLVATVADFIGKLSDAVHSA